MFGPDQERIIRLTNAKDRISLQYQRSRAQMAVSFEALNYVLASKQPVDMQTVKRGAGALVLSSAFSHSKGVTSSLIESSNSLYTQYDSNDHFFGIGSHPIGEEMQNNPSYKSYPDYWNTRIRKGVQLGVEWVLKEIEEGDRGLIELTKLPATSLRYIAQDGVQTDDGIIFMFPTSIPGIKLGLKPTNRPLDPYMMVEQLDSSNSLRN